MTFRSCITLTIAGAIFFLCPVPARCGNITWSFSGEFGSINDPGGYFNGLAGLGTPFQGEVTLDQSAVDTDPLPMTGRYDAAVVSVALTIGSRDVSQVFPLSLRVENDHPLLGDYWSLLGFFLNGFEFLQFRLILQDLDQLIFASDMFPIVSPAMTSLEWTEFSIERADPFNRPNVSGPLMQLVPEPDTMMLMVFSLTAALVGVRVMSTKS